MDTSQQYLVMSKEFNKVYKAHVPDDISGQFIKGTSVMLCTWPPEYAGKYYHMSDIPSIRECPECGNEEQITIGIDVTWLPTQEELQDIYRIYPHLDEFDIKPWYMIVNLLSNINGSVIDNMCTEYYEQFTSLEQVWMAYVMGIIYDMKWVNNTWVSNSRKDI